MRMLQKSATWYKNIIRNFQNGLVESENIGTIEAMPSMGRMCCFWYDPKLKETLPYYDTFPLSIPIEQYGDSWLGLNLHYLPPGQRQGFFKALYTLRTDKKLTEKTRLAATYSLLKGTTRFRLFEPCIKKYLFAHSRSPYLNINPEQWEMVVDLPLQSFRKGRPY